MEQMSPEAQKILRSLWDCILEYPKGPRTQMMGLGPKFDSYDSIWALKPYYSSPWTLEGGD